MKGNCIILIWVVVILGCSQGPLSINTNESSVLNSNSGSLNTMNEYAPAAIKILEDRCAICHTTTSGFNGVYNITDPQHLLNSQLIVAEDPESSPLYLAISSGAMPLGSDPLSEADQAIISNWITMIKPLAPPSSSVTFQSLSTNVLIPKCVACHSAAVSFKGYRFDTYAGVMNAVTASSPNTSKLYTITHSGVMPPSQPLSADETNQILSWISAGAPNN